jgi:uncharacterized protein DUF3788
MNDNAFIGKSEQPNERELERELGSTKALWDTLLRDLAETGVTDQEWTSYSPRAGWALRLKQKKRNIIYLAPCHGCFRVALALGEKAMQAAQQIKFPSSLATILQEAKRYPEGYAVRIEIRKPKEIGFVERLAQVKIEN